MNDADGAYVTEVQVCFGHKNSLGYAWAQSDSRFFILCV